MVFTHSKIVKPDGKAPDDLEKQIANALSELSNADDLKGRLTELYIVGAQVCSISYIDSYYFVSFMVLSHLHLSGTRV